MAALWTRTEGWVAGLRLAALSLDHCHDPSGFVAAFSGDDRAISDYLIGEVLDRQPVTCATSCCVPASRAADRRAARWHATDGVAAGS